MDGKQGQVLDDDLHQDIQKEGSRFAEDLDKEKQRLAGDLRSSCFDISRQKSDLMVLLSAFCGRRVDLTCKQETTPTAHEGTPKGKECGYCEKCYNWKLLRQYLEVDHITYATLNAVLKLARVEPVTEAFFNWLFEPFFSADAKKLSWDALERGVTRFRGYAMLRFGSFSRAYQALSTMKSRGEIDEPLGGWGKSQIDLHTQFKSRESPLHLPEPVKTNDLWFLGYLSKRDLTRDLAMYLAMVLWREPNPQGWLNRAMSGEQKALHGFPDSMREPLRDPKFSEYYTHAMNTLKQDNKWEDLFPKAVLERIGKDLAQCADRLRSARVRGEQNTAFYLSRDYVDVYVATSMRERWEFAEISAFVHELASSCELKQLNPRIFDPTQAYLKSRYDKGLIEGLMVSRAKCTVYLVQTSDTLGKDSELAATLAQGKPVIAYVPATGEGSTARWSESDARDLPVHALVAAILRLRADEHLNDQTWDRIQQYTCGGQTYYRTVGDFRGTDPARSELLKAYAQSIESSFKDRAESLRKSHPLALQVELSTGVANGLLVVDSVPKCAELLKRILLNELEFDIEHLEHPDLLPEAFVLRERISGSPFRVVTDHQTLTSAFWTTYFHG